MSVYVLSTTEYIEWLEKRLHDEVADNQKQTNEIERLRDALQPFACHCSDGWCAEYIKPIKDAEHLCEHAKARSALGEEK